MSESGYVELSVIAWLSGHGSATPGNQGLGLTYRGESAMAAFARPPGDPLVESLLVAAIRRINRALFVVLRQFAAGKDTVYLATCARQMVAHLRDNQLLLPGWSSSKGGRMRVEDSLLAESWNPGYAALGFDPADINPPFLGPALNELVTIDAAR